MRLELERLRYDGKEQAITTDSLKEQNAELERELEELRVSPGPREVARILLLLTRVLCTESLVGRKVDAKVGGPGRQGQEEGGEDGSHDGRLLISKFYARRTMDATELFRADREYSRLHREDFPKPKPTFVPP